MWNAQTKTLDGGRIRKVRLLFGDEPASYADALDRWRSDDDFRAFFIAILANAPYAAFLWETVPVTGPTASRAFEFVMVDSPALAAAAPQPAPFLSHFEASDPDTEVAVFANLGGDALLFAPLPRGIPGGYPHLAAFARTAPAEQQHALWRAVGSTVADRLADRPLWLNTNGLGVAWLHVRLDTYPKYYSFTPYSTAG